MTWRCKPTNYTALIRGDIPPLGPVDGQLKYGGFNQHHFSNVSIHYTQSTLPTPWPILTASLSLSLISAIRIVLFSHSHKISRFSRISTASFAVIQFVRGLFSLVAASLAVQRVGGRYLPPSALSVLLLSTFPYALEERVYQIFRALAAFSSLFTFAALLIMVALRLKSDVYSYGKLYVGGGLCPLAVKQQGGYWDGTGWELCTNHYKVGCLAYNNYTDSAINLNSSNEIVVSETVLGFIVGGVFCILGLAAILGILVVLAALASLILNALRHPFAAEEDYTDLHSTRKKVAILLTVAIVVVILVSLPAHIVAQRNPRTYLVQDSFGPPADAYVLVENNGYGGTEANWTSWTGDSFDGKSWTDFFLVHKPTDKLGFLEIWWQLHRRKVWNWIAIV